MNYENLKNLILEAVAQSYSTLDGIKFFVEPQIAAEIEISVLEAVALQMCYEDDLVRLNNGIFSAFFAPGDEPIKFGRARDGKVLKGYDRFAGEDIDSLPVMKVEVDNLHFKRLNDSEIQIFPLYTADQLTQIADLTAAGQTKTQIAQTLKINEHRFNRRARTDAATRSAINVGYRRLKEKSALAIKPVKEPKKIEPKKEAKPKVTIRDLRPEAFARLAVEVAKQESLAEESNARKPVVVPTARPARLCKCGNPLGPRVHECRECWLKIKPAEAEVKPSPESSAINKKIRNAFYKSKMEPQLFSEMLLDVFLETSPVSVKEKFAQRLFEEITDEIRDAA